MKQINDNLGHEAGDQALVVTADLLKKSFPLNELLAQADKSMYEKKSIKKHA
jgi:GGDEF domain-containing protein